jgi:hypothetical protein
MPAAANLCDVKIRGLRERLTERRLAPRRPKMLLEAAPHRRRHSLSTAGNSPTTRSGRHRCQSPGHYTSALTFFRRSPMNGLAARGADNNGARNRVRPSSLLNTAWQGSCVRSLLAVTERVVRLIGRDVGFAAPDGVQRRTGPRSVTRHARMHEWRALSEIMRGSRIRPQASFVTYGCDFHRKVA